MKINKIKKKNNPFLVFLIFLFEGILLLIASILMFKEQMTEWYCYILFAFSVLFISYSIYSLLNGLRSFTQNYLKRKIEYVQKLANTINTTIDENVFEISLLQIKNELKELSKYNSILGDTPSKDLKRLLENEYLTRQNFYERLSGPKITECDNMDGHDFEYFCAELLKKNGFENVSVTPGSGDQGIDIIAFKDGVKYGIQCKCYSSDIGNKAVQEAFSGAKFYECHVPVVLTNRHFTISAKELSEKTNVLLWDREYLEKLIESTK